jgi:hypothetical protein
MLMLTGPLYMLNVYDRVLGSRSVETLITLSVLVAFLYGLMGIFDFGRGRVIGRLGARFQARLDHRVFAASLRASNQSRPPPRRGPKSPARSGSGAASDYLARPDGDVRSTVETIFFPWYFHLSSGAGYPISDRRRCANRGRGGQPDHHESRWKPPMRRHSSQKRWVHRSAAKASLSTP